MPRLDEAEWVGERSNGTHMSHFDIACVHTIVGYAPAHAAHFSVATDGHIFQSRDTIYQSAANLHGNHRIIAIETADMPPSWPTGDGRAVPDFTDEQVDSLVTILQWCETVHGIPIVPCPNSKPSSEGIAYHRQGVDGNFSSYAYPGREPGGELWSSSYGKVCPGDRKIKTLLERIIPSAAGISPEEDVVKLTYIRKRTDPQVFLAGIGVTPRPVTLFADAEYHAGREGITIINPPTDADEDVADGAGQVRKVMVVNDGSLWGID